MLQLLMNQLDVSYWLVLSHVAAYELKALICFCKGLYGTVAPKACENFSKICSGEMGKPLDYAGLEEVSNLSLI